MLVIQRKLALLLAMFFLLLTAVPVQASSAIQKVTVSITSTDGPLPNRVSKRMEASITTVGKHVFSNLPVSEVEDNRQGYENIIKDVVDRVLVGYAVQKVAIAAGVTSHIAVTVAPWGDVVRDVNLEIDFGGLSPELTGLVRQDLSTLQQDLAGVLVGLPVDALDWAGAVSKVVIREILAAQLPEFRSNFDIVSGTRTIVKVSLLPQGPVVQDAKVILRSRTIPNVVMILAKPEAEKTAAILNGLPVAFVQRHSDYFNQKISTAVQNHPIAKDYGLTLTPKVIPGPQTILEIKAETDKYRVSLEGYVDMGKKEDNTALKLHAGKFISTADELFVETEFIPASVTWKFYPGWSRKLGATTYGGMKYDVSDKTTVLTLNQYVARDWMLRAQRETVSGQYEIGVRYKIHDLLSAEYVFGNHDNWLRVIGHL